MILQLPTQQQIDPRVKVDLFSASLVDTSLESGAIYEGDGFKYVKQALPNGTLHLIGLLSDGGVHSRMDQLQVCAISHMVDDAVCFP